MTLEMIPGLAVLLADKIYVTFAYSTQNLSGIKKIDDAFTDENQRKAFLNAIELTTGLSFDDLRGVVVVKGTGPVSAAIEQFSTCAFRLELGGPIFVARFLKERGLASGQELSVFAITSEDDALITRHRDWLDQGNSDDNFLVSYEDLIQATLQPVLAAVAITVDAIKGNQGDRSENYGNGSF